MDIYDYIFKFVRPTTGSSITILYELEFKMTDEEATNLAATKHPGTREWVYKGFDVTKYVINL